ncbi:23S rRNA pseudouridylate synthase C [compost metagenome]
MTGRTHQIRAQLSKAGFPIVGDHAYGATKIYEEEKINLKAVELKFRDPLTDELIDLKI